jgi:hypothetical protein
MTISRQQKQVPDSFPVVRFYLDDLESIISILAAAVEPEKEPILDKPLATKSIVGLAAADKPLTTKFTVGGFTCDRLDDLPKIAKSTRKFEMDIEKDWHSAYLRVRWSGVSIGFFGLESDAQWIVFHKLEPIFESRKLLLAAAFRTFVYDSPGWVPLLLGSALLVVYLLVRKAVYSALSTPVANAVIPFGILLILLSVIYLATNGTEVVFRNSQDHAAQREERLWKIIPAAIGGLIGFATGIMVTYLKCKLWP